VSGSGKKDVHLPATAEQTARIKNGEMVVVRYRIEADNRRRRARLAPAWPSRRRH
jgi:hypothetical protein